MEEKEEEKEEEEDASVVQSLAPDDRALSAMSDGTGHPGLSAMDDRPQYPKSCRRDCSPDHGAMREGTDAGGGGGAGKHLLCCGADCRRFPHVEASSTALSEWHVDEFVRVCACACVRARVCVC